MIWKLGFISGRDQFYEKMELLAFFSVAGWAHSFTEHEFLNVPLFALIGLLVFICIGVTDLGTLTCSAATFSKLIKWSWREALALISETFFVKNCQIFKFDLVWKLHCLKEIKIISNEEKKAM